MDTLSGEATLPHSLLALFSIGIIFSSPGQSPGRAIVLPLASALALASAAALAKSLTLKFFM